MHISIPAPLAERDRRPSTAAIWPWISIPAPLTGRDCHSCHSRKTAEISILAPLAGRDMRTLAVNCHLKVFQSSRPLRGATRGLAAILVPDGISILAPLAGRDPAAPGPRYCPGSEFQSSRPLRGATTIPLAVVEHPKISILAPLAGRDCPGRRSPRPKSAHFNPRAPCGARRELVRGVGDAGRSISILAPLAGRDCCCTTQRAIDGVFQSSRPLRGATATWGRLSPSAKRFQSSRPLRGATLSPSPSGSSVKLFQSSRPLRGATSPPSTGLYAMYISILAPLAGRDRRPGHRQGRRRAISILAPLAGRDHAGEVRQHAPPDFNPRAPCGARQE